MRASSWIGGVLVILLAVVVGLAQLLLPLVARHPQWVAEQITAQLQRPTSFRSMEGRWTSSGPLLALHDVMVGEPSGGTSRPLHIPEVDLRVDFGGWLLPSRHLVNVHVRGMQATATRSADGEWRVMGTVVRTDQASFGLRHLSADLWLDDLELTVTDHRAEHRYELVVPQLRVSRATNGRVRFGGVVRRQHSAGGLRVVGDFRDGTGNGQLWVGMDGANLQSLLAGVKVAGYQIDGGQGRIAAWLTWRRGELFDTFIQTDLSGLILSSDTVRDVRMDALHGLADLRRGTHDYRLRWAGADGGAAVLLARHVGTPQPEIGVAARQWQLAPWLPLLALKPGVSPMLSQWLVHGHPRALATRLDLRWSGVLGLQALDLEFSRLDIQPSGRLPGIQQLHGELLGDAQALSLNLPAQASTVSLKELFRHPLQLSSLAGTLALWKQDDAWVIGMDRLDISGLGYAAQVRGRLTFQTPGKPPVADLFAKISEARVQAAKLFWPLGSMSAATMAWLDHALMAGRVSNAEVVLHGDLAQWPFHHHEGRFEARVPITGLMLDYAPGWPRAERIDLVADFVNDGFHAVATSAQTLGLHAGPAVADIADFATSPLELDLRGSASAGDLMRFVRASPIGRGQIDTLNKLALDGDVTFAMHLKLPLHSDDPPQLSGAAELSHAGLSAPDWNLQLDQLAGPLRFDMHGLEAGPLQAEFHGRASTLKLAVGTVAGHADTTVWAQMQGAYSFADLVQDYPSLEWIGQAATGTGDFLVNFSAAKSVGTSPAAQQLTVDSDLRGIALNLPAPLEKSPASSMPLHLVLGLPIEDADLQVALGHVARVRLRLANAGPPVAGVVAFGEQMPQRLPTEGLQIRGHASHLDVTGWVQHAAAGSGGDGLALRGIQVDTDHALWFNHSLGEMRIAASTQDGVMEIQVSGAAMMGKLAIPTTQLQQKGVTARIQHLYWPADPAQSAVGRDRPGKASDKRAATIPVAAAPAPNPADTGIDPRALPPLHLWVRDLRLGVANLGDARLESWPTAKGMHIEQLRALSSNVQISATGDWNGDAHDSHSHMRINFSANDLGAMLGALGFDGLVHGGRTHDQLDASWPGAPSGLSLANMDGTLTVKVEDGRIPEATSPGVGRLLGLVSLAELPRRLSLDFGDVFGKGLAFDSITGQFHLARGNATTNNLAIVGPAANVTISGRTGLRDRDYDQEVSVVPHVGNSLPLVGAVVGGPVGIAAGLAVQGLLGKGLNKAASARYRITGSWDKPVLTLVEKGGAHAQPVTAPYSGIGMPAGPASTLPASSTSVH